MKRLAHSETAPDLHPVDAGDWGSDLDDHQIRRRQLAEIAEEILIVLRKKAESTFVPKDGDFAELE